MKIALASAPFRNGKTEGNALEMLSMIRSASEQGAECVLFGESALQGFDALTWNYRKDLDIAVEQDSSFMKQFFTWAEKYGINVSLGYLEKENGCIYSSQIVIGTEGKILANFRRVSRGWKVLSCTDPHYREGNGIFAFDLSGKRTAIALCGDLWYEERMDQMNALHPELVLWPVYCDYSSDEWNETVKYEYLEQASRIQAHVLLVNPYCNDPDSTESSKGCCVHFHQGKIVHEWPSGTPGMVITEV